jgi:hypothetical protein
VEIATGLAEMAADIAPGAGRAAGKDAVIFYLIHVLALKMKLKLHFSNGTMLIFITF